MFYNKCKLMSECVVDFRSTTLRLSVKGKYHKIRIVSSIPHIGFIRAYYDEHRLYCSADGITGKNTPMEYLGTCGGFIPDTYIKAIKDFYKLPKGVRDYVFSLITFWHKLQTMQNNLNSLSSPEELFYSLKYPFSNVKIELTTKL